MAWPSQPLGGSLPGEDLSPRSFMFLPVKSSPFAGFYRGACPKSSLPCNDNGGGGNMETFAPFVS